MAQPSLNPELRDRATSSISSTEEHPHQRPDIPASRYSGRNAGQLAYGARRIHDLYVADAGANSDRPPIATPGDEGNGSATAASDTTAQSVPIRTRMHQQAPGLMFASRDSWPAPGLQVPEQASRRVMSDDVWAPASLWVRLARGTLDDRRRAPLTDYWPFPTYRSGISAPTVPRPEAVGNAMEDQEQLGVKRFRASDGHRFELDDQVRQARRVGSPHRMTRRVPARGGDGGRPVLHPGSSSLYPCFARTRSSSELAESARESASASLGQQEGSNHGMYYCVRRDAHIDADTARTDRYAIWPRNATGSSYAPTRPFSALAGVIDAGAGAFGRERTFRAWGGHPGRATCGSLCPCRGLLGNRGVPGDGATPRHERMKVQRLSVDAERLAGLSSRAWWSVGVAAGGVVNGSSERTNVPPDGGGEPVNGDGYWASDPRARSALEESRDGTATASHTGRARPSGEWGVPPSMEGGGWAGARARRSCGCSASWSSSSRCFASRPTAALGPAQPFLHASRTRIPKRKLDRGDGFENPTGGQIAEQGAEMDVEEKADEEDSSRRPMAYPRGYFGPVPLWRSPRPDICMKGAPGYDAAVSAVVRRFKGEGTGEGAPSKEAVPISVSALASAITVEEVSPQEGPESAMAAGEGCSDGSDDSDGSTDAQAEISTWLHGTEDWWIY